MGNSEVFVNTIIIDSAMIGKMKPTTFLDILMFYFRVTFFSIIYPGMDRLIL